MANFVPLKRYMLRCLDRMIERYAITGPFLDVGCGRGDVSAHLARKGWSGTAIDFSPVAIAQAKDALKQQPRVDVRLQMLAGTTGAFGCVVAFDVLEHIEDDHNALRDIAARLRAGGHVVLAVPSNPREWRWDDDFYGHCRRYTIDDLRGKLEQAGLQPLAFWDFTFPVFWALRRAYTRFKPPPTSAADKIAATRASATVNAWDVPVLSKLLDAATFAWTPVYALQFRWFRDATNRGHEMFALAQKPVTR